MRDFLQEPWAPTLIFAIAANVLWMVMWISMWSSGRFKNSIGKGFPILVGVGLFNLPFGFLFLAATFIGTILLSGFWLMATLTNTYENERAAIATFLKPKTDEEKQTEGDKEEEKPTSEQDE